MLRATPASRLAYLFSSVSTTEEHEGSKTIPVGKGSLWERFKNPQQWEPVIHVNHGEPTPVSHGAKIIRLSELEPLPEDYKPPRRHASSLKTFHEFTVD